MVAAVKASNEVGNDYSVSQKQWAKWSLAARRAFNGVYYAMKENPRLFNHPNEKVMPDEHWNTVAWNAAWMAAEAVDGK